MAGGWDADDDLVDASLELFHSQRNNCSQENPAGPALAEAGSAASPSLSQQCIPPSRQAPAMDPDRIQSAVDLEMPARQPAKSSQSCSPEIPSTARRIQAAEDDAANNNPDSADLTRVDPTPPTPASAGKLLSLQQCIQIYESSPVHRKRNRWSGATVLALVVAVEPERLIQVGGKFHREFDSNVRIPIANVHLADEECARFQVTLWREKAVWAESLVPGELVQLTAVTFNTYNGVVCGNTARHSSLLRAWPAIGAPDGWPECSCAYGKLMGKQFKLSRLKALRAWAEAHYPWYYGIKRSARQLMSQRQKSVGAAVEFRELGKYVGQLVTVVGEWSEAALRRFAGRDRRRADAVLADREAKLASSYACTSKRVLLELLPLSAAEKTAENFDKSNTGNNSDGGVVIELRHRELLRSAVSGRPGQRRCACTALRVAMDSKHSALGCSQHFILLTTEATAIVPLGDRGVNQGNHLLSLRSMPAEPQDVKSVKALPQWQLTAGCAISNAVGKISCRCAGHLQLKVEVVMSAARAAATTARKLSAADSTFDPESCWQPFLASAHDREGLELGNGVRLRVMPSAAVALFGCHTWLGLANEQDFHEWLQMVQSAASGLALMIQPLALLLQLPSTRDIDHDYDLVGIDFHRFIERQCG